MRVFRYICAYTLVIAGVSLVLHPFVDGLFFDPGLTQFQLLRLYWLCFVGGFGLFWAGMIVHPDD